MEVKAWKESVTIPTYRIGEPDKNPMFLEKRVYQGSSGVVYPYPVIDKVYDRKEDKEWIALYLENEFLKVMILPELGGRIQMAYDKTNDYHFVYYNQVIKPALVGLAGPWISGGIEFNWPQHHRPSTFDATDFSIEENADGSKTIWVNEYEIMFRTRCSLGFTLYPDRAYIELHAKLHNRTPFPQTFLWWANPAVAVDEHYQSIFPPDVHAVYDHGKRDVSSFPIATGTYYKIDYSPGTDISIYNNIPVPTSYMAGKSNFNFVGGYHHKKRAGLMHIANHHVSPGKKQWTWGSGEFGKAWDKHLTDEDGPYFELMCGVYTDNQPDFSWIMPNEVREFRQYFMPYKEIGKVKNASIDAMVNLEFANATATIQVYITQRRKIKICLRNEATIIFSEQLELGPENAYKKTIELPLNHLPDTAFTVEVFDENDQLLVSYTPVPDQEEALPDPAKPIPSPLDVNSVEELYLAGLHLEQYRHATYNAEDYYREALRRDPSDVRTNNAMGLLYLRKGLFKISETYFEKAIQKLNKHNPNPYEGEPLYNLGLALKFQERYEEAYSNFYKSTWNAAMQDNAFMQLAYIDCIRKNYTSALLHAEASLNRNYLSAKGRHLKTIILRHSNKLDLALDSAINAVKQDLFDFGNLFELYLLLNQAGKQSESHKQLGELKELMRGNVHTYIEISLDYSSAGDMDAAIQLLEIIEASTNYPLVHYYLGYYQYKKGNQELGKKMILKGFECSPDRVFPNRIEDVEVLKQVLLIHPTDYKALYYLGNYYFSKRRYEDAKICWEQSIQINNSFPTVLRNLCITYFNKFGRRQEALKLLSAAFEADTTDARILFELDQLKKILKVEPAERLTFLSNYPELIKERDDLYIEYVQLHTVLNKIKEASALLYQRRFHPWEGGEGKTSGQHIQIQVELAKEAYRNDDYALALECLTAAQTYPDCLGEGKLAGAQENDIQYWLGCVYDKMNQPADATHYWRKASSGLTEPSMAFFYNDQQPDKIFYQGMALLKLGDIEAASNRFVSLIDYGTANLNKEIKMDFFAVSHPDLMIFDEDLIVRNNIHCHYLQALGWMGLGEADKAGYCFDKVLLLDPVHAGALLHQRVLKHQYLYPLV
ncbi:DUF5107 domain-containing protein [Flavihumibacter sp. UBA7668]|uniref:DUF5107 domain-containing protein n=1 Tax=Flavihumibacter sp. UBA7668 TaxID=1946542 RepID=UPI0025BEE617|nr:DUF5107 domain-containing protein [Flavihumibacter sp. UBA7668]